jgi:cytochrome c peroxidase
MPSRSARDIFSSLVIPIGAVLILSVALRAQVPPRDPPKPLASLKTVPVPEPANLVEFVADKAAAIRLGKALFWDMQAGGDGIQACASCHFHAGADNRRKNQLSPGLLGGDATFQVGGPNYTLRAKDFPFTRHVDESAAQSPIVSDANDVASSQGVFNTSFVGVMPGRAADVCDSVPDPVFQVQGINVRRVEPRNTPSMVNGVFNFDNFWDGRADHIFNGVSPFGDLDPTARVWKATAAGSEPEAVQVQIEPASLASQAVGPPLSPFEMSCAGRVFPKLGRKMFSLVPLAKQFVDPNDSVLGPFARGSTGINASYPQMIRSAFRPEWWSGGSVTIGGEAFSHMEANFSLFWGLAIQLYESTLVANDSRVDRFLEGDTTALSGLEQQGMNLFTGVGRCINCHGGAELTNASVRNVGNERLERMVMGNGGCAIYDNGFYNIGMRPTAEDIGRGGTDPFGNPLSDTRRAMMNPPLFVDPNMSPPLGSIPECDMRANVDGTFKTPALRNVELTGPYFHAGAKGTLRQIVQFYNRGGDFAGRNIANLDPDIQPLGLSLTQMDSLVAFLQALTDERTRQDKAPFDHPSLLRPNGCLGNDHHVEDDGSGRCVDDMEEVPSVGAGGRPAAGLVPLQPFLSISKMRGSGVLGAGRQMSDFGFNFNGTEEVPDGKVRFQDRGRRVEIRTDTFTMHESTETCVRVWGPAVVNDASGFSLTAKGCDHRQPGANHDTFEITVWDAVGTLVYTNKGVLSGGNLQAFIR